MCRLSREDVIAATQRQRPTAGLCYYHASRQAWGGSFYRHYGSAGPWGKAVGPQKLAVAKAEFDSMERLGIVRSKRQLAFVSEFTTDIQHVAGKDNMVADCLSRSIVDAVNLGVDYGQMAADQASDPEVQALRAATTESAAAGVRVVGAADVQAIREDVIAATQRQRPTAGLCYYHARNRRLVNAETFATLPGSPSSTRTSKLSSALSSADVFQRLLVDFPDLTTPTFSSAAVKHGVDHFIATTGPRSTPGQGGWTAETGCG
ncbi:hypothetical protein AAFF_G00216730 [Aldrovandia affinis]|uniref:Uncharacterized protein n=1 Tax=Aldrovandia affinis TaxID=143900 RepID=A0AAD7RG81_9TELE|nr:hypothetical protein AAFF_G00216730 [Aldrovandia affinis]